MRILGSNCILKTVGIYKSFGPTRALIDVNLNINKGEVHGLIGENGSGKSTICSIIAGAQAADKGTMYFNDKKYMPLSMIDAQKKGVSMIVQEMGTIPSISVASNIFVGKLDLFTEKGILRISEMNKAAKEVLIDIGAHDIDPGAMIDTLNFEDRKIVEIARAMHTKPNLLIIDETTTALASKGRKIIYDLIESMYSEGKSVIFISHDLDELMQVCTNVTVLRDGVVITTMDKSEMTISKMRENMVGRELTGSYYRADFDGSHESQPVLELKQVTGDEIVQNLDLTLHKGEILGIGGLSDSGMHEVGRLAFGIDKPITGEVLHSQSGKRIIDPSMAIDYHMAYVSKERDKEGLIMDASILENIVLPSLKKLRKGIAIVPSSENKLANEQKDVMSIKCRDTSQHVQELSGGNKQKVVFSRWLGNDSEIFILDCPTRGIDVGVKAMMYNLIYKLKKQGKSIIMISEELPELIGMSDRILIMKEGKIAKEFTRSPDLSEQQIIEYMI